MSEAIVVAPSAFRWCRADHSAFRTRADHWALFGFLGDEPAEVRGPTSGVIDQKLIHPSPHN